MMKELARTVDGDWRGLWMERTVDGDWRGLWMETGEDYGWRGLWTMNGVGEDYGGWTVQDPGWTVGCQAGQGADG